MFNHIILNNENYSKHKKKKKREKQQHCRICITNKCSGIQHLLTNKLFQIRLKN